MNRLTLTFGIISISFVLIAGLAIRGNTLQQEMQDETEPKAIVEKCPYNENRHSPIEAAVEIYQTKDSTVFQHVNEYYVNDSLVKEVRGRRWSRKIIK